MGGWGSGRRWSSKNTTSEYLRLDIRRLQREGVLAEGTSASWQAGTGRVPVSDLSLVEKVPRAPCAGQTAKTAFDAEEIREHIAIVQHKAIDELSGEIAILKKYLKSKRAPQRPRITSTPSASNRKKPGKPS